MHHWLKGEWMPLCNPALCFSGWWGW